MFPALNRLFDFRNMQRLAAFRLADTKLPVSIPMGRFVIRLRENQKEIRARWIGARIRAARQLRGWTQEDFAQRANIARANVARLEAGTHMPAVRTLRTVARSLDVDLTELLEEPSFVETAEDRRWLDSGLDAWAESLRQEDQKR